MERGGMSKASREATELYRIRSIDLRKKGWAVNKIAEAFGVHEGSVSRWFGNFKKGGVDSLKKKKAKGNQPIISTNEKIIILNWLKEPTTKFGFETPLWTLKKIQLIIKKEFNKKIHLSTVWLWLKKWGFTNQKPKKLAAQQDEKAVKKWLKEEWPKIKEHRRKWQAMLYFQDESGIELQAVMGKTWAPKGETPIIKTKTQRGGLCLTSAISPAGRLVFRIEKGRVDAEKHIEFLTQLMQQHPHRKLIIVEDNAPSHTSHAVKSLVASNPTKIAIYYLPSYSPELNPDEHVWAYLKAHQLKNHQAQTKEELKSLVKRKMQGIQRKPKLVNSFFMQSLLT